jgi:hypothetical protein
LLSFWARARKSSMKLSQPSLYRATNK